MNKTTRVRRLVTPVAVLALLIALASPAFAFDSGGQPAGTGSDTITWTGQGASGGTLNTIECDTAQDYLHWVFTTDGGSASPESVSLHLGGSGSETGPVEGIPNPAFNQWDFFTPYYTPDTALTAYATFDVAATGNGAWILTISHGCPGDDAKAMPLEVTKSAEGTATTTYGWTITKSATPRSIHATGGSNVGVDYTITVSPDEGTMGYAASGVITVSNPNEAAVTVDNITDTISNGGTCTIDTGGADTITVASGTTDFDYTCTYDSAPDLSGIVNTVTVDWSEQDLDDGTLAAGSADYSTAPFDFTSETVDECVNVTDVFNGGAALATDPGQVCVGDANPTVITYARTVTAAANTCTSYGNTAEAKTNDTATPITAEASVSVCGNVTGGLTIGFWQNKNGQALIKGAAATGVCPLTGQLRVFRPFQDLSATATCSDVAKYVTDVIKAANASGASMNAMLKAQMLATTLDVWNTPSLGTVKVDLTLACKAIGTCSDPDHNPGQFSDTSAAFGNPPAGTCQSVSSLLTFAGNQSNVGGSAWYAQVKAVQEMAKNTFDTINNDKAWTCSST